MSRAEGLRELGNSIVRVMEVIQRSPVAEGQLTNATTCLAYLDGMVAQIVSEIKSIPEEETDAKVPEATPGKKAKRKPSSN